MIPVAVVAAGAISALGLGPHATSVGAEGDAPQTTVRDDLELAAAGLRKSRAARVADELLLPAADRACALLEAAARELVAALDRDVGGWRERRVALSVGTSAGGMRSLERALSIRASGANLDAELARAAFYAAPLAGIPKIFGILPRVVSVLGACMASTFALGLGCRWLEAGTADLVIAGGYDALSAFLGAGFEALGATTASEPLPFRAARDGMALGEGAALLALMRASDLPLGSRCYGFILGFGASSDAVHVTAPDPSGQGLARAARAALDDAGLPPSAIGFVSAHATATLHNDSAEAKALAAVFGSALESVAIHPFKGVVGHTFGAAGALETLAALDALERGILPGAVGMGATEPGFAARLLAKNERGASRYCLKLSAAFGGSNAALVLAADPGVAGAPPRPRRRVTPLYEGPLVTEPDFALIARATRLDEVRRARLERASALAVTAVAQALEATGALDAATTGIVVGTFAASLEADEVFDARRREGASVEPRRFPATSPNLPAGACSIAFDFRGPSLAIGGGASGPDDALAVGRELVASGDAERVIVVRCNDVGSATRALCRAAGYAAPEDGARALILGSES